MNALVLILELIRFIPLLAVIGYAAYYDLTKVTFETDQKSGESIKVGNIPNKLWRYAIIGGSLTALETLLFFSIPLLVINVIFICASIGFGFFTYLLGGGGADSKAFMTIGVSAPLVPLWSFLWPVPTAFLAFMIGSVIALPFLILRKTKISFWKRPIRFLPFIFIGLLISVIL